MQITRTDIYSIANGFLKFYKALGYVEIQPDNIIQERDTTLTYTNSTIVPLKAELLKGIKGKGFVLLQPCLRLKNLKRNNFDSAFTSYFRMVGVLSSPQLRISDQAENIKDYFIKNLSIKPNEITIHYNDETFELAKHFSKDFKFESNSFSAKFYNWKYGIENVAGLGITFFIEKNKTTRELGNFIEIRKESKIIGYEFGFGIETCYGILNGIPDNFLTLFNSNENKKINDLFIALCVITEAAEAKEKISVFAETSLRKLRVELSYEFFKTKFEIRQMEKIEVSVFDISKVTVNKALQEIENRVTNLVARENELIDYVSYLTEQTKKTKSRKWAEGKFNNYIRKNNLNRILQSSSNEKLKKINIQFEI